MMTLEQYLLGKIAEECAEIAQRASKAQRFGLTEKQPGQDKDNAERLMEEMHDLHAVLWMLQDMGCPIDPTIEPTRIPPIVEKVTKYMDYSRQCEQLEGRIDKLSYKGREITLRVGATLFAYWEENGKPNGLEFAERDQAYFIQLVKNAIDTNDKRKTQ